MTNSLTSLTLLLGLSSLSQAAFNWANTKTLITFGDSYTFIQGTAGSPSRSFIGDYQNLAFSSSTLLNDKIVQNFTSTAEGGPNWVEYTVNCAVKNGQYAPVNCPIQTWDFAFSGASISTQFLPKHLDVTVPLVNQTQQYLQYAAPVLAKSPVSQDKTKALVAFWIGINDVYDSKSGKPSSESYQSFWGRELDAMFAQSVTAMYKAGYQNFVFLNLPPLDRTPANQAASTKYPTTNAVNIWGNLLASRVSAFQSANAGSKAMLYDVNTFLNGVMNNPSQYGITNTTSYCPGYNNADVLTNPGKYGCAPQSQYFWRNALHL